jgi:ornithine cyclodeaminase/alanine dehydrogenase-like protein (mu-crystallin family)
VSVPIYAAAAIRRAVGFADLIEPLRQAFTDFSNGQAQQTMSVLRPGRQPEDGDVLIKAGCIVGHDIFVVKAAPWFRSNTENGRPQGGIINVLDSRTGHAVAVLVDEHYLSDIRTAAAGALTADILAPPAVSTAGILGTGAQAFWQAIALAHVRQPQRLLIWGRHGDRAAALAERLAYELPGVASRTVATAERAVRDSDVVVTATAATTPLVNAAWLHPGQHITAVGADEPGKCELAPGAFRRADLVVVDSRAAAVANGSTWHALQAGALSDTDMIEIGRLGSYQRAPSAITIACLVGIGVQDVIAAEAALARLTGKAGDPAGTVGAGASE